MLATHDVELAAELAHRVVILADGEIVADGPTAEVVVSSPAFAPQVAKILAPRPGSPSPQVAEALAGGGTPTTDRPHAAGHADRPRPHAAPSGSGRAPSPPWPWSALIGRGRLRLAAARRRRLAVSRTRRTRPGSSPALLPLLVAVVVATIADSGWTPKAVAMLGVLAAAGAALRPLGRGDRRASSRCSS